MKHNYERHDKCEIVHCVICDGGLAHCLVCKGFEGSLPSDCPGIPMDEATQDQVYNAEIDFVCGAWVDKRGFI